MPLEMLREEITPPGLHYVLAHYDLPAVDPATWRLVVDGEVEEPQSMSLTDLTRSPHAPCGSPWSVPATAGPGSLRARSASPG